jgi:chromosome segregation ATPase
MEERKNSDIKITCRQCGKEFVFTKAEQEFYEQKGLSQPRRCKECRSGKRDETQHLTCAQCGAELDGTVSAYCGNCHASNLASTQLECELNNKKRESTLDEVRTKLETTAVEKSELGELLSQKEQRVAELEQTIGELNQELDEVRQLHEALDRWFQPSLKSLEKKLEERLKSLEQGQNSINQSMSQLAQKLQDIEKGCQNITLFELIKRSFRK